MMSLSMVNFGKTCRGFSALYIHMKVSNSEAYQSAILISSSIATFDNARWRMEETEKELHELKEQLRKE